MYVHDDHYLMDIMIYYLSDMLVAPILDGGNVTQGGTAFVNGSAITQVRFIVVATREIPAP